MNNLCVLLAVKRVTFLCTEKADKAANPVHSYVAEEAALSRRYVLPSQFLFR
jgi:hypothetical protein